MEQKSNPSEDQHKNGAGASDSDGAGWKTVRNRKKEQYKTRNALKSHITSQNAFNNHDVFSSLEKHSEERRLNIEARTAALLSFTDNSGGGGGSGVAPSRNQNVVSINVKSGAEKKKKDKDAKKKRMIVTPAAAAAAIDAADLSSFLAAATASYASQEDIQLMRFADYFGQAYSCVSAAQFPWWKLFGESALNEIADVPFCHIPEAVYRISAGWIDKRSDEGIESFVIWSLNSILSDLAMQKALSRGPKKGVQTASSKSQVAMFLVMSVVLRRRPDILINLLPLLRDDSKYHGQDKLPLISWMIAQASEGDRTVGLYLWAHHMLPLLGGQSTSNPKTRDLVLQLVERILSVPNAHKILSKGAVRNGERLIPPSALALLLRLAFPAVSARLKATERFEAIYPTLIYVALYGSPRSEELKQLSWHIQPLVLKVAGEAIPDLSEEAAKIFIWCLIQNSDCYKHWGNMYMSNVQASVVILRRLRRGWNNLSPKLSDISNLRDALKGFRQKNKNAAGEGLDAAHLALIKEADKYCSELLAITFRETYSWVAIVLACVIWMALGVGIFYFWLRETY